MDWGSFTLGFLAATAVVGGLSLLGFGALERRRLRDVFDAHETVTGKRTRRIKARDARRLAREGDDDREP